VATVRWPVLEVLQIAFGWDDEHLNRFEIRGREYAVYRHGGGMIGIDAKDLDSTT
jgi:hypothetical protein